MCSASRCGNHFTGNKRGHVECNITGSTIQTYRIGGKDGSRELTFDIEIKSLEQQRLAINYIALTSCTYRIFLDNCKHLCSKAAHHMAVGGPLDNRAKSRS